MSQYPALYRRIKTSGVRIALAGPKYARSPYGTESRCRRQYSGSSYAESRGTGDGSGRSVDTVRRARWPVREPQEQTSGKWVVRLSGPIASATSTGASSPGVSAVLTIRQLKVTVAIRCARRWASTPSQCRNIRLRWPRIAGETRSRICRNPSQPAAMKPRMRAHNQRPPALTKAAFEFYDDRVEPQTRLYPSARTPKSGVNR